jgi:hypothetical protein
MNLMGSPNNKVVPKLFYLATRKDGAAILTKKIITTVCCRMMLHSLLCARWMASRAMRPIKVNRMASTSCQKSNIIPCWIQEKGKKSHVTDPGKLDGIHFMPKDEGAM